MCAILIKSLLLFLSCVFLQVLIWRVIPEDSRHKLHFFKALPWMIAIFIGVGSLSGYWMAGIPFLDSIIFSIESQFLAIMCFHFFASMIYISLYTVFAAFSPSMELLKIVESNMPNGIARNEIKLPLIEDVLFKERYENLITTKMILVRDDHFYLAWRGWLVANVFLSIHRLLGITAGKG